MQVTLSDSKYSEYRLSNGLELCNIAGGMIGGASITSASPWISLHRKQQQALLSSSKEHGGLRTSDISLDKHNYMVTPPIHYVTYSDDEFPFITRN